jgi:hypothetical protein
VPKSLGHNISSFKVGDDIDQEGKDGDFSSWKKSIPL